MATAKRTVVRSATVGVPDNTVADFSDAATFVGAPANASVTTGQGGIYNPSLNQVDNEYPHSVTFTWVETV